MQSKELESSISLKHVSFIFLVTLIFVYFNFKPCWEEIVLRFIQHFISQWSLG